MIRRYIAASFIVFFFSYAAYLIITDGGKANTIITFEKLNQNIQNKFWTLTGQKQSTPTNVNLAAATEKTANGGTGTGDGTGSTNPITP